MNLKLAKLVLNYTAALRINESSAGIREHVPVRSDYCVDNHVLTFTGGSKVQEGETTRPAYAKLSLFTDTLTNGLLDLVFESPSPLDSIDKTMTTSEFDMLMLQFGISQFITPLAVPRFLPSHMRSLGARFIELLFDNDVAVNSAGSILHITRRCLGHKSCETTQRYISIKCSGDMPNKIGCVSHVDQSDLTDGSFVVKLYEESSTKRKRRRGRKRRHNKREDDAASALLMLTSASASNSLITVHCAEVNGRHLCFLVSLLSGDDCFDYFGLVLFFKVPTLRQLASEQQGRP